MRFRTFLFGAKGASAELDYNQAAMQLAEAIAQLRVIQQLRKKFMTDRFLLFVAF